MPTPYGMPAYVIERVMAKRGRLAVFDRFDPRKTALLVIDMQNFYVGEIPSVLAIIPNINRIAQRMRELGGLVVWLGMSAGKMETWALEGIEAPVAVKGSGGAGSEFLGFQRFRVHHEAALHRIWSCGYIYALSNLVLYPEDKIMRIAAGKHIGRTHHREHQRLGLRAQNVLGIHRTHHGQVRRLHGRQPLS